MYINHCLITKMEFIAQSYRTPNMPTCRNDIGQSHGCAGLIMNS